MKLTLKTLKLQEIVAKSAKGAGNNKMIPITGLMAIELQGGTLTLTTTDASNYLKIFDKGVEGDDFYVVVQVDTFSKLIAKTTVDSITLTLKENCLEVRGNGTYNIELPLDEEGKLIRFPEYKFDDSAEKSIVHLTTIKSILGVNKAALAETLEIPCYTAYYFDEMAAVTTDTFKICHNAINVFNKKLLLPGELLNLLDIMTDEKITIQEMDGKILFTTGNCSVFGYALDGIDDFNIDVIRSFVNSEFTSMCKLPKQAMLSLFDRLSLFVTSYDKNGINLTFTNDGLLINSKQSTGTELIKYQGSENFQPFTCCADIQLLKSQIAAQDGEVIEMWYALPQALKMVNGKITQIVALLTDERDENDG